MASNTPKLFLLLLIYQFLQNDDIANPISIYPFTPTNKMSFPHRRESIISQGFLDSVLDPSRS
ncbi:hypothetical protein [Candidatus Tisiphia endosymbiont of Hybos culiciformis]|uniref:hypothetical protein n=1 Tax=Candidatus Tisiphia endosymbiont of Hybos culiciformis TaxID=3139331 RepID=UPI003CCB0A2B